MGSVVLTSGRRTRDRRGARGEGRDDRRTRRRRRRGRRTSWARSLAPAWWSGAVVVTVRRRRPARRARGRGVLAARRRHRTGDQQHDDHDRRGPPRARRSTIAIAPPPIFRPLVVAPSSVRRIPAGRHRSSSPNPPTRPAPPVPPRAKNPAKRLRNGTLTLQIATNCRATARASERSTPAATSRAERVARQERAAASAGIPALAVSDE